MLVTWNSFVSPMGALTLVECASGPLVVEYAASSRRNNWAERLRLSRADARALVDIVRAAQADSLAAAGFLYGEDAAVDATLMTAASTNTLPSDDWRDEIHPNSSGFKRVADRFDQEVRAILNQA